MNAASRARPRRRGRGKARPDRAPVTVPSREYLRDGRAPLPRSPAVSVVMSRNRGKATGPELTLLRELDKLEHSSHELNARGVPGRPDIVYPRQRVAVFVHGCFWHHCPTCCLPLPKTHTAFWQAKFDRNTARDALKIAQLTAADWRTLVVWEHEIKADPVGAARRIVELVASRGRDTARIPGPRLDRRARRTCAT